MSGDIYVADTSALFAAWVERYPLELLGSVWQFIDGLDGRLLVCEEVLREIDRHAEDPDSEIGGQVRDLRSWLHDSTVDTGISLLTLDGDISRDVQQWVGRIGGGWPNWSAIRSHNSADPWVIAYAGAIGANVISEERRRSSVRGGVKIPDVCDILGIVHLDLLGLFRTEGYGQQSQQR